jgi:hypothetical protein
MIAGKKPFDSPKYRPDNCLQRSKCTTALSNLDAFIDAHWRWRYETGEEAAVRA